MYNPDKDLHTKLRLTPELFKYAEVYFHACFEEVFPYEGASWETQLNGTEILEIVQFLEIPIEKEYIIAKYNDRKSHDAEVFHSVKDPGVFACFNLQKDPIDQNDMFLLEIRFTRKDENILLPKLLELYRQLCTSSVFCYDLLNNRLYNKVFKSSFYFYTENYAQPNRKLIHQNLPSI